MSPVSRARKKSPQPSTPSVNGLFKDVLRDFSAVAAEPGPFDVELLASEVLGQWWDLTIEGEPEGGEQLGLELIAFAQRKITPGAAALLAALKVLAETEEERTAAAEALAVVLSRGIPEPEWAGEVGRVTVGEIWRTGDVYGDETSLLCTFSRGDATLGLLALLDFTELGRVRDLVVIDEPHEVLAEMRTQIADDGELVVLEKVEPADAHRLLLDGIAATDGMDEPDVGEDYTRFHAVATAWLRALPEPSSKTAAQDWSDAQRDAAVDEFLGAVSFADVEAARNIARLLVDHGCRTEPADPLRVGPEKLARFLESLLGGEYEVEDEDLVPPVVLAWASWSASRNGLSEAASAALVEDVNEYLAEYLSDEDEDDDDLSDYLDGTESAEEALDVVARRKFAVPSLSTVIGDEELTDLDPSDPEQRRMLVIGDHPEYHESLANDEFDGTDGLRLALETTVVDQLWEDAPEEVWPAARTLLSRGLSREEVLGELVTVLENQLEETEEDRLDYDLEGYREALAAL
ncbi:hypothetical protein VSH64_37990 [Amycolatopsis rhabdoformis]|uniref:DUF1841 family protein n=1 Tax=Amycolatopsis rhabdoformis TaxID=1448059 RepID=A0ABZ1I477_9PSEU|nr:hypothetical protein [Amycolatopsis rhabdoformis]WSE28577.1 hypothetical protein VSH64_37990 [Amycolatopsis rhabdoformis]